MPASLFPEMERSGGGLEDQRALQLALELSMLGLNNENDSLGSSFEGEGRSKKSQNTTECVPVPSSEHVAEIVGRQGKLKIRHRERSFSLSSCVPHAAHGVPLCLPRKPRLSRAAPVLRSPPTTKLPSIDKNGYLT